MQEDNTQNQGAPLKVEVAIRRGLRWVYELRSKLSAEQLAVVDAFIASRGNRFGTTEAGLTQQIRWDKTGFKLKALQKLTEHFRAGWPAPKSIHYKFREFTEEACKAHRANLPRERRDRYHPEQFVAYRHRKVGHA